MKLFLLAALVRNDRKTNITLAHNDIKNQFMSLRNDLERFKCELQDDSFLNLTCEEFDSAVVTRVTLQLTNCSLRFFGRAEICPGAADVTACIRTLSTEDFALYNSYYIQFRNACAYFKMLALERENLSSLNRVSRLHRYMHALVFA